MILVAFVLVLVAAVALIIGAFFTDPANSLPFIWASIGACVATFGVLTASYLARRRQVTGAAARPSPLGDDEDRSAPVRASSAAPSGTVAAEVLVDDEVPADATVAMRPVDAESDSASVRVLASDPEPEQVDASDEPEPEPAPRAVAPRRVVRRAPTPTPAAPSLDADEAPTAAPTGVVSTGGQPTTTRRVVRRVAVASGETASTSTPTRVVRTVQRAPASAGTDSPPTVVRRAGQPPTRTVVRRVASATPSTDATAAPAAPPRAKGGGTRGAKARSVLDEIKGVGPAKRDALLKTFGSLEEIADADIADLTAVKGVGASVAGELKRVLKDR